MAKGSTKPGFGAPHENAPAEAPAAEEPFDPTTLRDVVVEAAADEKLVAKYRTDPRLEATPEMALLRGITAEKQKRGLKGFRDGLADAKNGSALRAHRDDALQRLADETAAEVRAKAAAGRADTVPNPPEPPPTVVAPVSPVRRLLLVAALVVLAGVIVMALVGNTKPKHEAVEPQPVASAAVPTPTAPREAAAPPLSASPTPAPVAPTAPPSTASALHPTKPKSPATDAPKVLPPPPPPGTAFDPMQGT